MGHWRSGEDREVTVYFSDIQGFTTLNEMVSPTEMSGLLGDYLGTLSHAIQDAEGTVVQYIGDAIMALWGAPLDVPEHPVQACRAALRCRDLASGLREGAEPVLRTRIGLHTAVVAVGHFGAPDRMYYGAIGDGVNLAARLEGLNKQYGTWIMLSDATQERVREHFLTRKLDVVAVKGKSAAWAVYELVGDRGDVGEDEIERVVRYERALELYLCGDFDSASVQFAALVCDDPGNTAASLLLDRCTRYAQDPPTEGWTGVYRMQTKK